MRFLTFAFSVLGAASLAACTPPSSPPAPRSTGAASSVPNLGALTGKAQVTSMVTRLLSLDGPPRPADAADALAIAICHIWRGGTRARLQAAAVRAATAGNRAAPRPASRRTPGGLR